MNNKMFYDFEGFRVDTGQKCLWRDENIVSLTPKAFETLLVLVRNNGNIVTKNAILDEVWKDTFVEESTLAQNISTLRKTLSKYDQNTEFIVTIPRRGYRFVADVTESFADEKVLVVEKHSVTQIIAERGEVRDSAETAVAHQEQILKPNKTLLIGLPLALASFLIAGIAGIYFLSPTKNFYNSKFKKFRTNTLFSSGNLLGVAASQDGKYIAIIERDSEGDSISLKQIKSENRIDVLPKSNLTITGVTFSPDSENIYYSAYKKDNITPRIGSLYKISILGGAPEEILKDIDSPVAVSNDGKRLAFTRNELKVQKSVLVVADAEGSNEKELLTRELRNGFSNYGVSWSPDGKSISAVIIDRNDENLPTKMVVVDSKTAEQKVITEENWLWIGKTQWFKDGSGIALVAYGSQSPNITDEIWFVSYPEGKAKMISNGIKGINGFSLTDDLNSIIATKMNRITGSYVSLIDEFDNATEISKTADEVSLLSLGTVWTKDEKLVYSKTLNGNADIWMMDSDGANSRQLTSDESADFAPKVSEDGRYIFFLSNRSGATNIWRIDSNGENPTKIIDAKNIASLSVSQIDKEIFYSAKAADQSFNVLWKSDFEGTITKQITSVRTFGGKISPDGKYIFCFFPDANKDAEDLTKPLRLTVLSSNDGKIVKQFAALRSRKFPTIEWKKDSKGFLILKREQGGSVLSIQLVDEKEAKILKEWKNENVYQIAVSKDGEKLFFEKGEEVNSIIQLKDTSDRL